MEELLHIITAGTHSYFAFSDLPFFLPADVKAHTQREKDHSEVTNILVCV